MSKTILKGETKRATTLDAPIADPIATVALISERQCEAACPSNQQPSDACEEVIRARAQQMGSGWVPGRRRDRLLARRPAGSQCGAVGIKLRSRAQG